MDWNSKSQNPITEVRGQGHKNWCHLDCGEENLDWKVAPIEGKGLGIIALRDFSAKSRIIVEGCQSIVSAENHPETINLMPENGTILDKFNLNGMGCGPEDEENVIRVLCVRMFRVNHACDNNASHIYDDEVKVKILYTDRDIKTGEEICISYTLFNSPAKKMFADVEALRKRFVLKTKWEIDCPANCICRDTKILRAVDKAKELDSKILQYGNMGDTEKALQAVQQLLVLNELIRLSLMERQKTYYDGFQICVMSGKHFPEARNYIQELYDTESCILHPNSPNTLKYEKLKNDLNTHRNYLLLQQEGGTGGSGGMDADLECCVM